MGRHNCGDDFPEKDAVGRAVTLQLTVEWADLWVEGHVRQVPSMPQLVLEHETSRERRCLLP